MILYMVVTPDEFELPLFVSDSCEEIAELYNLNKNTVRTSIGMGLSGKQAKRKFLKIVVEDED